MNFSTPIAKHLREVFFGGNWTWSNLREVLSDVTDEEANKKIQDFNTILALTYHIYYFVQAILPVMDGKELHAHDKFSFDHPIIDSEEQWKAFQEKIWMDVERLAVHIENISDERWMEIFVEEKYGTYYRNIHGLIEHTHYHLGQIVILKKLVKASR